MARPSKPERFKWNGNRLQVFVNGERVADLSCAEMILCARVKRRIGTREFSAQLEFMKESAS